MSSAWVKHLHGLSNIELNTGKQIAFATSAEMISRLEKEKDQLRAENEQLKQRAEKAEREREDK